MKDFCPYGTYLRATAHHHLDELTPMLVVRLIAKKFKKTARKNPALRLARHATYRGAILRLREDQATYAEFRM